MSKSKYITLSSSIPIYNSLLEHIEKLLDDTNDYFCPISEVRVALDKGYEKFKIYYAKTDDSYLYPIATSNYLFFILFLLKKNLLLINFDFFSS